MRHETKYLQEQPFHIRHWGAPHLPKLLMLHGFPEYGGAWAELAGQLSDHYHCIAPDQRGYGQSWAPPQVSAYTTSALVADMVALLEEDGPVTVLGHDWGAAVAYGLAMFHPDLVSRLIILNGVHPVPFQRAMAAGGAQTKASQYITFLRSDRAEHILAADNYAKLQSLFSANMDMSWLQGTVLAQTRAQWARPGVLTGMLNWYRASPLRVAEPDRPLTDLPDFPTARLQVRCPHLLIWGANDTALLPEATQGLETFAADLTRIEVQGADHWLHHQKPADVARHILDWMP